MSLEWKKEGVMYDESGDEGNDELKISHSNAVGLRCMTDDLVDQSELEDLKMC